MNQLLPLNWSAPQIIHTERGARLLRTAPSTDTFRKLWNTQKEELKKAGYSVRLNKQRGTWEACHWSEPDAAITEATINSSRAVDADIEIPLSDRAREKGYDYFGFQRAGIKFMSERSATLLADDMGVGKTIQIIGAANVLQCERILIVCPASMLLTWGRELYTWLARQLPIYIISAGSKPRDVNEQTKIVNEFPTFTRGVVVINWDILHKVEKELRSVSWDLAAFDESQYAKNSKTRRAQYAFGRKENTKTREPAIAPIRAKYRICASGTPIKNRPIELFSQLNYLDEVAWPSWYKFATRYCGAYKGRFGFDTSGATNLDELQQRLRSTIMIRRMKVDVLTDLPEKTRQVIAIPANGFSNLLEKEIKAHAEWEAAKSNFALAAVKFTELAKVRLEVGLAKVPYVLAHLEEVSQKTIIFCRHKEVQKQLAEALSKRGVVIYNGDLSPSQKDEAMTRFQNDPSIQFFIGTITSCGVGLTLTAASYEVFAELEWTPADLDQAEDRAYRQGQRNAVLVHHVVFDGSLDDRMLVSILQKQKVIKRTLDDQAAAVPQEQKASFDPEKAMRDLEKADAAVTMVPPAKIEPLLQSLRLLAGMCDGARSHDASGFNKLDSSFGKSLASQRSLSPKQAVAAYKMVRKYKKQLPIDLYSSIYGVNL